ncbi:MAG: transposase [Bdellovibrionota bacterium]
MRSTKATGGNSFREPQHFARVQAALLKFAQRHGVKLYNFAIQSNHLHLYVQLTSRQGYIRFIRALTGAIARMFRARKFWDRRPFSRIVRGPAEDFALDDYIKLNQIEAQGFSRKQARKILRERNAKESRIAIKRLRERAAGSG